MSPMGGAQSVSRVERAAEVEPDHRRRPADADHDDQDDEQPRRRSTGPRQHGRPHAHEAEHDVSAFEGRSESLSSLEPM